MLDELADLVGGGGVVVLSGAGLSTESGIPDYRGGGSDRPRPAPMTYQAFVGDPLARRRYWARSHLGWRRMSMAAPNDGHRSVVTLERWGLVDAVITQNVDGLHTAAGSSRVIDLHGRLDRVVCLGCGGLTSRRGLDERLREANAAWSGRSTALRPDGDVEASDADVAGFIVVDCVTCGGVLKPDVVYFGESVPRERVDAAYALTDAARALLVLGSSLTVFSGRRFVVRAFEAGIPVGIVNRGATRGDGAATVRIDAPLGEVMRILVERLDAAT
jgi:NAD-dependent SIR2 family protein deacetylase